MIGNRIKTTILLAFLAALFIGIGSLLGGRTGMIIGLAIAMLINLGSFWFSDKIVLKMYKAKPVSKDHKLYQIVHDLSRIAKIPMPKVYTITAPSPNAFATGRSPKNATVAATESLLHIMSEEEVKAVMAHELSHIKHRDTLVQTIAVGIASAIAFVAEMFQWAAIFGFGGNDEDGGIPGLIGLIILAILTPIIATLIQLAISRQREYMADAGAVQMMKSPMPLINALNKLEHAADHLKRQPHASAAPTESLFIVNPFKGNSIFKLFSTHPATKDRIAAMKKVKIIR
ncbi:MAG: zinc metalloprotease HtpX [Nanoarchaeota archaeon]|nr:zinc metalloprotease HtpX [Nanoarchaeota archaeon]